MDITKALLSKEFLSQFKTAEEVDSFLKKLHAKVYEGMLEGEMENHLGYGKNAPEGKNSGNSRNGSYPKTIQTEYGQSTKKKRQAIAFRPVYRNP